MTKNQLNQSKSYELQVINEEVEKHEEHDPNIIVKKKVGRPRKYPAKY